ncbi:MAG: GGDEF domain-containing protein [Spirochaetaceae bacterium]
MDWNDISSNPLLINNFSLLSELGIIEYIESINMKNKELEDLISEAYIISEKKSVDELVGYLVQGLTEKFVPSNLVVIVNEGVLNNSGLKFITYKNLKRETIEVNLSTLEPYVDYFNNNPGTMNFKVFEDGIANSKLVAPFKEINTEIIIPVHGHSGLYGLILFGPKILDEDYTDKEIKYIDRLMSFISVGIQNNIHYENSVKDGKTGLYNHLFFISRVNEEFARSKRSKTPSALIIIDIDNFKIFNNDYGHLAGDEVIIKIAHELKHLVREMDIVSRFGGEEFTVLLPETTGNVALMIANRIRSAIELLTIKYQDKELKVTVSIGVSVYNWVENLTSNDILNRADEALYLSKENGRNKATIYRSGLLHRAGQIKMKKK